MFNRDGLTNLAAQTEILDRDNAVVAFSSAQISFKGCPQPSATFQRDKSKMRGCTAHTISLAVIKCEVWLLK